MIARLTAVKEAPLEAVPVEENQRIASIDIVRGGALLGVLLINLESDFRLPLARAVGALHTDPGVLNHIVDWILNVFVEGKAFTAFSLLFGVGMAVQAERTKARTSGKWLLVRRLAILLVFGIAHLVLLWNGDILALYAVAGLIALAFEGRTTKVLCIAIAVIAVVSSLPYGGRAIGGGRDMTEDIERALSIYAHGSYWEIVRFRLHETPRVILPIYMILLPRTVGLFLLGMLAHRRGIFRQPDEHRSLLLVALFAGAAIGTLGTSLRALDAMSIISLGRLRNPAAAFSIVPLSLSYIAALLLYLSHKPKRDRLAWLSPVGRIALTNYLTQSMLFGFLFYGYGLGLFGRLSSAEALPIGLALFAAQIAASAIWLRRFRWGPAEWLWRTLTYGKRQPMLSVGRQTRHL